MDAKEFTKFRIDTAAKVLAGLMARGDEIPQVRLMK